jgi:L-asparaginase II
MPAYESELSAIARAFIGLDVGAASESGGSSIVDSIWKFPRLYAGVNRYVTNTIEASKGRILGKCGADGVYVLWWRGEGLACIVRVADGTHAAAPCVFARIAKLNDLYFPEPNPRYFVDIDTPSTGFEATF